MGAGFAVAPGAGRAARPPGRRGVRGRVDRPAHRACSTGAASSRPPSVNSIAPAVRPALRARLHRRPWAEGRQRRRGPPGGDRCSGPRRRVLTEPSAPTTWSGASAVTSSACCSPSRPHRRRAGRRADRQGRGDPHRAQLLRALGPDCGPGRLPRGGDHVDASSPPTAASTSSAASRWPATADLSPARGGLVPSHPSPPPPRVLGLGVSRCQRTDARQGGPGRTGTAPTALKGWSAAARARPAKPPAGPRSPTLNSRNPIGRAAHSRVRRATRVQPRAAVPTAAARR